MRRKDAQRLSDGDRGREPQLRPPAYCLDVAQVTVYGRALGMALAQKGYGTHESSEWAAL